MPLTYIYNIIRNVSLDYEDRILMAADVQSLSLANGIELGSVVLAYYLTEWILLIPCLLDMLTAAALWLGLELYVVMNRLRKSEKVLIRKCRYLLI